MLNLTQLTLMIVLTPLATGVITGLFSKSIGRAGAHWLTTLGMGISFLLSLGVLHQIFQPNSPAFNNNIYAWGISGNFHFYIGFLVDKLSAAMMAIVTFISFMVHIYSIGYMKDDAGYQRFFSYISLFTFGMLMLVTANNFLQLYFGWEGVGLVSYLLIGFWFKKESANAGSLKAFLVNRVGDFGFLLGIAALLDYTETLDFSQLFVLAPHLPPGLLTLICLLLFVGAMGKSAQMPLHVWLPESMEGPTPISALIHAATMVTAGVYLLARLSPIYEHSAAALSVILIIGATGALFMGFLALVQTDIKRVIAYSTLSQLGYMIAAMGASADAAGIFHLMTHAFFKALLFLAAGSVIIALHHEQDMRRMGGLKKYMPVTYMTFLIGALALSAVPPFSGFFSKELIIEAIHDSSLWGSHYAYICVAAGAFVTPLYIFRALFMTFHGPERFSDETRSHLRESSTVILIPLVILAIPSLLAGYYLVMPLIFNSPAEMMSEAAQHSYPLYFSIAGLLTAWVFYRAMPQWPAKLKQRFNIIYKILFYKYGFDAFNEKILVRGTRYLAHIFFTIGDLKIVDHMLVNGSGRAVSRVSLLAKRVQSGYLYHYALLMIVGLLILLAWMVLR